MAIPHSIEDDAPQTRKSHQRFAVLAALFSLSLLTIIDRVALSSAKDGMSREFGLTDVTFGFVFGSFALGYALFQIPSGILADNIAPRQLMAILVGLWSVFTALTSVSLSAGFLILVRFFFGCAEAGAYPVSARVVRSWFPVRETGIAQGIIFSGSRLGAAIGLVLTSWMVSRYGWHSSFVALGALGISWIVLWLLLFCNTPQESPSTSIVERDYIRQGQLEEARVHSQLTPSINPWRRPEITLLMLQYFASNFTFFLCFSWLLPYLVQHYRISLAEAGLLSSIPLYFGMVANWLSGAVVDGLYLRGFGRTSRIAPAVAGFVLSAAALCIAAEAPTVLTAVIAFSVATFGVDLTLSPSWTVCIDLGGAQTGAITGAMNMCGNLGSFASSMAFPVLLKWTKTSDAFFYCAAAMNLCSALMWIGLKTTTREVRDIGPSALMLGNGER